jgi:hypothetical protein
MSTQLLLQAEETYLSDEKAISDPKKNKLPTRFWNPAIVKFT